MPLVILVNLCAHKISYILILSVSIHSKMNLKKRKYVIAATGMIVAYNYTSKRKTRSKWVKNWLLRREEFSHMTLLRELAENEPNDLKNYLTSYLPYQFHLTYQSRLEYQI